MVNKTEEELAYWAVQYVTHKNLLNTQLTYIDPVLLGE